GVAYARVLVRRLAQRGARRARALLRGDGRGRGDRGSGNLRFGRPTPLVRDPRGPPRRAAADAAAMSVRSGDAYVTSAAGVRSPRILYGTAWKKERTQPLVER